MVSDQARQTNHIIPSCHDALHIKIAWEERDDPIWYNLAIFNEDASEIADNGRVVPDFEPGADRHLVTTSRDDLEALYRR